MAAVALTTKQLKTYAYPIAIIIVISLIIYYVFFTNVRPSIDEIWVINLDKDSDRLKHFLTQEPYLPTKIQRWKATYGKDEDRKVANKDGVHYIISRSNNSDENKANNKVISKPGEIGCWLSHKRLLTSLYRSNVPSNYGHLILEDDTVIPKDFNERWNKIRKTIPTDWDIVYLGINKMNGDRINDNVVRWKNDKSSGNWGTHAYLVRHKALKHILEKIEFMSAPIDVQYYNMLGALNIYIVDPPLITVNDEMESSIDQQQERVM
jgi:glycosyl transferase, family 25